MARTVNFLSLDNRLDARNSSGILRDKSELSVSWRAVGGSYALTSTQADRVSPNFFSLRVTPNDTVTPVQLHIDFVNVNLGAIGSTQVVFHSLVKCNKPVFVNTKLQEYTTAYSLIDGVNFRTEEGRFSSVRSNHIEFPSGNTNKNLKIRLQVTEHDGQPFFVTIPVLIDDNAFLRSMAVQNMKKQLPTFYWDIDSQQQDPDNPFFKLLHVLTSVSDDVALSYVEMFDYELNELSVLNDGTEDWARSTLTDPTYVDADKRRWLAQFTGSTLRSNINYKTYTYDINELVTKGTLLPEFNDQFFYCGVYGTTNASADDDPVTGYQAFTDAWSRTKLEATPVGGQETLDEIYQAGVTAFGYNYNLGINDAYFDFNVVGPGRLGGSGVNAHGILTLRDPVTGHRGSFPVNMSSNNNIGTSPTILHFERDNPLHAAGMYPAEHPNTVAFSRFVGTTRYDIVGAYSVNTRGGHSRIPTRFLQEFESNAAIANRLVDAGLTEGHPNTGVGYSIGRRNGSAIERFGVWAANGFPDDNAIVVRLYPDGEGAFDPSSWPSGIDNQIAIINRPSLSLSDFGRIVAISKGGTFVAGSDGQNSVHVYQNYGTWDLPLYTIMGNVGTIQLDGDIMQIKIADDGSKVVVYSDYGQNAVVSIWEYSSTILDWEKTHSLTVQGESQRWRDHADLWFYHLGSMDINHDASVIAVGHSAKDVNGTNNSGYVRVYKLVNGSYTQVGEDLYQTVPLTMTSETSGQVIGSWHIYGAEVKVDQYGGVVAATYGAPYVYTDTNDNKFYHSVDAPPNGLPLVDIYDISGGEVNFRRTISNNISGNELGDSWCPVGLGVSDNAEVVGFTTFNYSYPNYPDAHVHLASRAKDGSNTYSIAYQTTSNNVRPWSFQMMQPEEMPMQYEVVGNVHPHAYVWDYDQLFSNDGFDLKLEYNYGGSSGSTAAKMLKIGFITHDGTQPSGSDEYLVPNTTFETFLNNNLGVKNKKFWLRDQDETLWEVTYDGFWNWDENGIQAVDQGIYWVAYNNITKLTGPGPKLPAEDQFADTVTWQSGYTGLNALGSQLILVSGETDATVFTDNASFIEWQLANSYYGRKAGSRESMVEAAARVLSGSQIVAISPNYDGDDYRIHLRTLAAETPDVDTTLSKSEAVLVAVEPTRPVGFVFTHEVVDRLFLTLNNIGIGRLDLFELG